MSDEIHLYSTTTGFGTALLYFIFILVLSFLALPVIPELKLTDKGLVDVDQFRIVPVFGEE